ncbi:hypothetical protein [Ammoniphilus sp. CFH 90114]|uniref:hypothetical protein n=1 Tax=Ammoniphilus sp. CFH 90114 TaxID=2493665 RepID=UPI0013E90E76|nr:hypothetical protein [Ammoniphilus sp. CFH 90114]
MMTQLFLEMIQLPLAKLPADHNEGSDPRIQHESYNQKQVEQVSEFAFSPRFLSHSQIDHEKRV